MKVLFDSSVLVAAIVASHPAHDRARRWLNRALSGEIHMAVAAHSLAELYAVLTALPLRPKIHPQDARRAILENIEAKAEIISLDGQAYGKVIEAMGRAGLTGGLIYDALIAEAGRQAGVDQLLTLDVSDFHRVAPDNPSWITQP